jgi:hypothetical protein
MVGETSGTRQSLRLLQRAGRLHTQPVSSFSLPGPTSRTTPVPFA